MRARVNLRAELAVGRHAFDPGRVPEIAAWIRERPRRIPGLPELRWDDDAGVAGRAADALERITRRATPSVRRAVEQFTDELLGLLTDAAFPKLKWNLALTLPRLTLSVAECRRAAAALETYLEDASSIVKTAALHGLADLTRQNPESLAAVVDLLRMAERSGTPAMRARSRILLKMLEKPGRGRAQRSSLHMFP